MSVGLEPPSKPKHNKASVECATPESSKGLPPKLDTKLASKSAQKAGETTPANNPKEKTKNNPVASVNAVLSKFSTSSRTNRDVTTLLNRLLAIARKKLEMRIAVLLVVDRSNGTLKARLHSGLSLPKNVTKIKIDPRKSKLLIHLLGAPDLLHWAGPRGEDDLDGLLLQLIGKEPTLLKCPNLCRTRGTAYTTRQDLAW